jgi:pyruvate dehydrogenase E2 component (dihydrolipoamide acetyltransferase)
MPILGADMEAGTLVAWRKQPGERVRRGDIVAEVETEKGLIEVEIFVSGVIERLLVQPGQTVPVGTVLALVREDAEAPGPEAGGARAAPAARRPEPAAAGPAPTAGAPLEIPAGAVPGLPAAPVAHAPTASAAASAASPARPRVSPAARRRAAELGVDVAGIRGTGPGGSVVLEDVERAAATRPAAVAPAVPGPPAGAAVRTAADLAAQLRLTIGAAMARSKREIPHYYLATTVDVGRALEWLRARNAARPVTERILPAALLLRAVALAAREVPELNARWDGEQVIPSAAVHLGVAIALRRGGLVAPALHDADRKSLGEVMAALRDLVTRARAGRLRSSELADPTLTVTALGDQGVDTVFGIIYPPQVAIVGFGRIVERPWVLDGRLVARPVVTATLSADHRVTDGHRGALFLAAVERRLQDPAGLEAGT